MRNQLLSVLFGLVGVIQAQHTVSFCPQSKFCLAINVPEATASSGDGDTFFQITAPTSTQWAAIGQGTGMAGAQVFVIYADSDGKNVTLSPRLAVGHVLPQFNQNAKVTLLAGSGITNNVMTANIRCSSCKSWNGGSMSFTDTASDWLWAIRTDTPLNSNSQSAVFSQHDVSGTFNVDLTKATGGSSANPFVAAAAGTSGTGTSPSSTASGSTPYQSAGGSSSGITGVTSTVTPNTTMIVAHGVLMSLAFLILFPFGAMSLRLLSFPGLIWFHAGTQLLSYAIAIAGMGIGISVALQTKLLNNNYHPIIGLVVVALLVFQPFLGLLHHFKYRQVGRRTFWSHAHMWFGRCLLILGAINGGLGLQLAGNTTNGEIAYGVVAGVIFLLYIVVVTTFEIRKKRNEPVAEEKARNGQGAQMLNN